MSGANSVDCCIVLVTVPDDDLASDISARVVKAGLAACVSRFPVQSVYEWQGQIHEDVEVQLIIKTGCERYDALEECIKKIHPYEVPEIVCLDIADGSSDYLGWITEATGRQ